MIHLDSAEIINLILRISRRDCRQKNPHAVGEHLAERSDDRLCEVDANNASFFGTYAEGR